MRRTKVLKGTPCSMMKPKAAMMTTMTNNKRRKWGSRKRKVNDSNAGMLEELYKRPNATERLLERFQGKDEK
jgi:hypothetical protein